MTSVYIIIFIKYNAAWNFKSQITLVMSKLNIFTLVYFKICTIESIYHKNVSGTLLAV